MTNVSQDKLKKKQERKKKKLEKKKEKQRQKRWKRINNKIDNILAVLIILTVAGITVLEALPASKEDRQ